MRKILLVALLAGTAAGPAFAQTANSPFTGPRVEALLGYDVLKSGNDDDDGIDTSEDEGDESLEGAVFGVGAGFDFDLGGVVAGVEGEFSESSGKQERDETVDLPFRSRIETGRDLYVGGRIGFVASPNALVYLKGGYTNTSIEARFDDGTDRTEFDTNVDGWRLGAGVEYLLSTNAFVKAEYRYSNYNTLDFSDDEDEDFETGIDLDRHQIMAGVGFRF
jgi:outer membrane immunogenic protein